MSLKNKKTGKGMADDAAEQLRLLTEFRNTTLPNELEKKLMDNTDKAFDEEKYPKGGKWSKIGSSSLTKSDKKDNSMAREDRRGILVKSGDLRKSIETETRNGEAVIGTDSIYAQIHNEGLQGNAFGKFKFDMPKRQFMPIDGEEPPFQNEIDKFMDEQITKILG